MRRYFAFLLWVSVGAVAQDSTPSFRVTYVAADAIYIQGGREAGLAQGFKLTVRRIKPGAALLDAAAVAEVAVVSVAETSAVCEVQSKTGDIQVGDTAILSANDAETVKMLQASRNARKYAQVISFTEGDPIDEEAREYVPRPPLPEVNRLRGRVSYESSLITDHYFPGAGSQQHGIALRADMTRIGGTFWNVTGYLRTRLTQSRLGSQETISDLMNRTYHMGIYYNNPKSANLLGFGRLLLPWAASLDTIDGGYYARRLGRSVTTGVFAGTTPDPTSWNYAADREMAGVFVSAEGGSFETARYSSTTGLAVSRRSWKAEREFLFVENTLTVGTLFSVFHNMQADRLSPGRLGNADSGVALSRSFVTVRFQPVRWLALDLNHNHFRGIPTFDTRLLGTGLLDKLVFQGLSGGFRLDIPAQISLYSSFGRNKRENEARPSWNLLYGATIRNFFDSGLRIDVRRSTFDSAFGKGSYYTGTVTREITDRLRLDVQLGKQNFSSPFTETHRAIFVSGTIDWFLGRHYSVGSGYVIYRGKTQNYDQLFTNLGYRF